jgi:hypothetical protein
VDVGRLERVRTEELIARFLPPAPATVLDVGGGPGAYAVWLARRGYAVHLVDPVELHVEQAREASARQAAGLTLEALVAIEGLGHYATEIDAWLDDPARREPALLGASPHFLAVGRRRN